MSSGTKTFIFAGLLLFATALLLVAAIGELEQSGERLSSFSEGEYHGDNIVLDEEIGIPEEAEILSALSEVMDVVEDLGPINSLLVSQRGELLGERYFGSMRASRANNIKSASKSILSLLTGIAIDKGYLEGVDQPIGPFFPEIFEQNPDPERELITIEDLLTMRSGLASTSGRSYGAWVVSSNWMRWALNRPMTGTPGVDRNYSTGNTHLLSVIITRATGMSTLQFANRYLFGPLNIRVYGWDRDPQGYYFGGNNMALLPRDMVKIGQLMLDMGEHNGEQIISPEWIIRSVDPVTGRRANIDNYGYLWFRRVSADHHMVYAFGNGGQYIMVLPELDAVIAVTTWNETGQSTRQYRRKLFDVLDRDLVPLLVLRRNGSRDLISASR
ncbi:MAG: serine hydrolase [Balneolaceae bacterium]